MANPGFGYKNVSVTGHTGGTGRGAQNGNLGPPNISEITRARKLKLKSSLDMVKYFFGYKIFFHWGHPEGAGPANVNLRPILSRKLNY